jgi:DNA replication and repair protein RecF
MNGAGKTNILEGISFLCLTKSFYAANDSTALQVGAEAFAVEGIVESDGGLTYDLRVVYSGTDRRKEYLINRQSPERMSAVVGEFPVVVLSPENASVTFGGPGDRRRFIDLAISQASRAYLEDLLEYRRILRQRNRILADNRETGNSINDILDPWNESIVTHGARITHRRMTFIREFEPAVRTAFEAVAGAGETPSLTYEPSIGLEGATSVEGIQSALSEGLSRRFGEERRTGTTLTGPHRDELVFRINTMDLRGYASQGQHKTFLVALKLAEFVYLKQRCKETPLLLLDDVLSELDQERADRLLGQAEQAGQTFITSTDARPFMSNGAYRRFWVAGGTVRAHEEATSHPSDR